MHVVTPVQRTYPDFLDVEHPLEVFGDLGNHLFLLLGLFGLLPVREKLSHFLLNPVHLVSKVGLLTVLAGIEFEIPGDLDGVGLEVGVLEGRVGVGLVGQGGVRELGQGNVTAQEVVRVLA